MSPILSQFFLYHASNSLSRRGCCAVPRMCRPNRCFGWPLMVWSKTLGKQHANSQAARKGLSQIFSICGSLQGMDLGRPLNIWWGWFKNTLAIFPPMVQIERLALCHFNLKDPISVDMCRPLQFGGSLQMYLGAPPGEVWTTRVSWKCLADKKWWAQA